jgi:hypothetical protein
MPELIFQDGRMFGLDRVEWLVWFTAIASLGCIVKVFGM